MGSAVDSVAVSVAAVGSAVDSVAASVAAVGSVRSRLAAAESSSSWSSPEYGRPEIPPPGAASGSGVSPWRRLVGLLDRVLDLALRVGHAGVAVRRVVGQLGLGLLLALGLALAGLGERDRAPRRRVSPGSLPA